MHSKILWKNPIFLLYILYSHWFSGRVFTNDPGDQGSISGQIISKTQKVVLDTSLLNTQQYKMWIDPGKGVSPSPTPRCSCFWKGSLRLSLDYSRQLYLLTENKKLELIFSSSPLAWHFMTSIILSGIDFTNFKNFLSSASNFPKSLLIDFCCGWGLLIDTFKKFPPWISSWI